MADPCTRRTARQTAAHNRALDHGPADDDVAANRLLAIPVPPAKIRQLRAVARATGISLQELVQRLLREALPQSRKG